MTSPDRVNPGGVDALPERRVAGLPWRSAIVWTVTGALAMATPGWLGWGWSLSLGWAVALLANLGFQTLLQGAGLLSFGHALYLGLGAWMMAWVMRAEWVAVLPWVVWPWLMGLATGLVAWLLAFLQARHGGVAFAMISLGLAEAAAQAVLMLPRWFGGDAGWSVSRSAFEGGTLAAAATPWGIAVAAACSAGLMLGGVRLGLSGHRARLWQAQANDDERLEALGFSAFRIRRAAVTWAAGPLGMAGAWMVWWSERFSAEWWSAGRSADLLVIGVLGAAVASAVGGLFRGFKLDGRPWSLGLASLAGATIMVWSEQLGPAWSEAWSVWLGAAFGWVVWQGREQLWRPGALATTPVHHPSWEEALCRVLSQVLPGAAVALGLAVLTHAQWQWRWSAQAEPTLSLLGAPWRLGAVDVWVGLIGSTMVCLGLFKACAKAGTGAKGPSVRSGAGLLEVGQQAMARPQQTSIVAPVSGGMPSGSEPRECPTANSGRIVLSMRGLEVRRGRQAVLLGLNLDLHAGEILALVGPNGAGKSTLLEAISGRLRLSKGELLLDGRSLRSLTVPQRVRAGLARSFQGTRVFESLSVREHLAVAVRSTGAEMQRRAWDQARSLGLSDCMDVPASELNPEALRCLELALTLALPGQVLLLDEPTAGLGPEAAERVMGLLSQVLAGRAAVIVEHDLSVVRRLCDRVAVLADGQVLVSGPPAEVLADTRVRATYGEQLFSPHPSALAPIEATADLPSTLPSPVALSVEALTVFSDGHPVLGPVTFDVHAGEILVVQGATGSGCSTLLRALMGLTQRQGRVVFAGQVVTAQGAPEHARLGMAWVAEDRGLVADLSVKDHLRLAAWAQLERAGGLQPALDRVWQRFPRLRERQGVLAGSLSGGERQMLALARCWMVRPRVLLLDEPAEGLSPLALQEAELVLRELSADGSAILMTEHKPLLSLRLARRALVLHRGVFQGVRALDPGDSAPLGPGQDA